MTKNKNLVLTWIIGIFLGLALLGLINLGIYAFFSSPKYETYCPQKQQPAILTQQDCENNNGYWQFYNFDRPMVEGKIVEGYCDVDYYCRQDYESALKDYNKIVFYILAFLGFMLLLIAIFYKVFLVQLTTLFGGAGIVIEAIVRNFNDTKLAFFTLLLLIIIISYFAYKKFKE